MQNNSDNLKDLPTNHLIGKISYGNLNEEEKNAVLEILKERNVDTTQIKVKVKSKEVEGTSGSTKTSKFVIFLFILLSLSAANRLYKKITSEEKLKSAIEQNEIIK